MLEKKIQLNDAIRNFISDTRKSMKKINKDMTADNISVQIGRSASWLSQIENGRLKTVKTNDLVNAFSIIKNCSYESAYMYADDKISAIKAAIKHGIIDESGNIIDFSEYLIFDSNRDHLKQAIKKFNYLIVFVIDNDQITIKATLKNIIHSWITHVVYWITRCFPETSSLFNDEVSMTNLFLIIETSYKILNDWHKYYGLNVPEISTEELKSLKNKLNDATIIIPRTKIKALNEYKTYEIDEVILHYSPEDYLKWKNHGLYLGDDKFPLLVNYKKDIYDHDDHLIMYDDITTATGLSEEQYLYIIKQLCYHFDSVYKACKHYIKSTNELLDKSNDNNQ